MPDINFWASIATIISIFLALWIFWADRREQRNRDKCEYLNQLQSLRFELEKNRNVVTGFFKKDKDAILNGQKVLYFRYSVSVINRLIGAGKIQDATLLRNLDAIADDENQTNRILDVIGLMAETSQIASQQEREMFERRIRGASVIAVNLVEKLEKYLPEVIAHIDKHIADVNSDKASRALEKDCWVTEDLATAARE